MSNYYYILILLFYWIVLIIQFVIFLLKSIEYNGKSVGELIMMPLSFLIEDLLNSIIVLIIPFIFFFFLGFLYKSINLNFILYLGYLLISFISIWASSMMRLINLKMAWVNNSNSNLSHSLLSKASETLYPSLFAFLFWFPVIFYYLLPYMNGISVSTNSFYLSYFFKFFCSTFHLDPLNGWFIFMVILGLFVLAAFPLGINVYIYFFMFIFSLSFGYLIFYWLFGVRGPITLGLMNFDYMLTYEKLRLAFEYSYILENNIKIIRTSQVNSPEFNYHLNFLASYCQEHHIHNPVIIKQIFLPYMKLHMLSDAIVHPALLYSRNFSLFMVSCVFLFKFFGFF